MASKSLHKKTVFENGLTLITEQTRGFRSLAMGGWVKVGTRHENPRVAGISHFLEHMLFKGTKKRTAFEIAQQVDQVGGEFNAFTTREYTCFHLLLLDRDFKLGLDILSDVILNSEFKPDEIERERQVILQEVAMVEDNPEELAHDIYFEQVYGQHGLGHPILGSEKSLKKMSRDSIFNFFRYHYRPDQLVLTVVGDVSHEDVIQRIKPLLSRSWLGREKALMNLKNEEALSSFAPAPPIRPGFWWVNRPTEQVHIIWGVPGTHYTSEERFAAFLLNIHLGGGMSSVLFQEIREKNALAYTVYSSLSPFIDSGLFMVYCATQPENVEQCLKLIQKNIRLLTKKPLSKKEVSLLKENLKGTLLLSSDSVESRMARIAKNEIFLGREMTMEEVCSHIDRVSSKDILQLAQRLFQKDSVSLLALGPKPSIKVKKAFQPELLRR